MKANELKETIIEPVLEAMYMSSPRATQMLLAIAAVESDMCKNLKNTLCSSLGPWQIEKKTFEDIKDRYLMRHDKQQLRDDVENVCDVKLENLPFEELLTNFKLGCAFARIRLWWVSTPLPEANDIEGLAVYWKEHYNTALGAGTEQDFVDKYNKYVTGE